MFSDSVTIEGAGSGDKLYDLYGNLVKEEENYAYSVYASDGTVNISGGNFIGVRYTFTSDKETYHNTDEQKSCFTSHNAVTHILCKNSYYFLSEQKYGDCCSWRILLANANESQLVNIELNFRKFNQ